MTEEVPKGVQFWRSGHLAVIFWAVKGDGLCSDCRKRFVGELLLSLHDSPLAGSHLQHLSLGFLCNVPQNPAYAIDLATRAGTVIATAIALLHSMFHNLHRARPNCNFSFCQIVWAWDPGEFFIDSVHVAAAT